MTACQFDIGDHLYQILLGIGTTLGPIIGAIGVLVVRKVHKELTANGGQSVKDSVQRTESAVNAMADSLGVPVTPSQGTTTTTT